MHALFIFCERLDLDDPQIMAKLALCDENVLLSDRGYIYYFEITRLCESMVMIARSRAFYGLVKAEWCGIPGAFISSADFLLVLL